MMRCCGDVEQPSSTIMTSKKIFAVILSKRFKLKLPEINQSFFFFFIGSTYHSAFVTKNISHHSFNTS